MGKERLRGLEVIARGKEHTVYRPKSGKPNVVFKVPRTLNYLLMLGHDQAEIIHKELLKVREVVAGTDVKIPGTRIYPTRNRSFLGIRTGGYIIEQRYIEEDGSVSDIGAHLISQGLHLLKDDVIPGRANYASNNVSNSGVVYRIDTTKGRVGRFLESKGIKLETYRKIRPMLNPIIKLFRM